MSNTDSISFESTATEEANELHASFVEIYNAKADLSTDSNPFRQLNFGGLDNTGPMCSTSWKELNDQPFAYWDQIVPEDPASFDEMRQRYEPWFDPQTLAGRTIQNPIDESDCRTGMSGVATRLRMPVIQEPVSHEYLDADTLFTAVLDVKQEASVS